MMTMIVYSKVIVIFPGVVVWYGVKRKHEFNASFFFVIVDDA